MCAFAVNSEVGTDISFFANKKLSCHKGEGGLCITTLPYAPRLHAARRDSYLGEAPGCEEVGSASCSSLARLGAAPVGVHLHGVEHPAGGKFGIV
jgi:hypothetical protein